MEMPSEWLNQNIWWIILLTLWDLGWKGVALWRAAHKNSKPWFVALLVINSSGLLPIFYIFVFSKEPKQNT